MNLTSLCPQLIKLRATSNEGFATQIEGNIWIYKLNTQLYKAILYKAINDVTLAGFDDTSC